LYIVTWFFLNLELVKNLS
jgi:hypothetical protein